MNDMTVTNEGQEITLTMDSLEIAEYTGKEHFHIKRDIKHMLTKLELDVSRFGCIYLDGSNRKQTKYVLDKELTTTLVSGYNLKMRNAIVKRWMELETKVSEPVFNIPQTYAQALALASEQALLLEQKELKLLETNAKLEEAAPSVEFVDGYVKSEGNKGFRQVAKILKANESEFRDFLYNTGVMYKLNGEWTAKAAHLNAKRFFVTTGESNGRSFSTCKFTPKGVVYIAGKWIAHTNEL